MAFKTLLFCCFVLLWINGNAWSRESLTDPNAFYQNIMNVAPLIPANNSSALSCAPRKPVNLSSFQSSTDINYAQSGWSKRVSTDRKWLASSAELGRLLLIDFATTNDDSLVFRYLSNGRELELYEPWSSSKIFAYTAAMAKLREQGIGATGTIGEVSVADLITSINSYESSGKAPGDSNAIATFFANLAGRDFLTELFHARWLLLEDPAVRFRGAYGNQAFNPFDYTWHDANKAVRLVPFQHASEDPGYQPYRCATCGLTGNKPMHALAQAEWLKRLATHSRIAATRHPLLEQADVDILLYGSDGLGGMMAGISRMLADAIARAIEPGASNESKAVLDNATRGQWRIFQKIGWGPSETRGAGEVVVLAHVCLPFYQGGREFSFAAQTAQSGNGEIFVGYAGIKMQHLLNQSMRKLFALDDS